VEGGRGSGGEVAVIRTRLRSGSGRGTSDLGHASVRLELNFVPFRFL
jgi:hypothetical protein